jgi:hypothetical protein
MAQDYQEYLENKELFEESLRSSLSGRDYIATEVFESAGPPAHAHNPGDTSTTSHLDPSSAALKVVDYDEYKSSGVVEGAQQLGLQTGVDEPEIKAPKYIHLSSVPGLGYSILPQTLGQSSKTPMTTIAADEEALDTATKKRRLSQLDPGRPHVKPDRLPSGVSRAIAASLENSSKRIHPNRSNHEPQGAQLIPLIADTSALLTPYLNLHHSCAATQPLQIIQKSLASSNFTPMILMSLLTDARELLKVLAERQTRIYQNLMPALSRFEQAGMESVLYDAKAKAEQTDADVKRLAVMIIECNDMNAFWAAH